jgi:hypothetical protein
MRPDTRQGENEMTPKQRIMLAAVVLCGLVVVTPLFIAGRPVRASEPPMPQGDSNPALNTPDRFAWETFVSISRSAGNGTNDALWETWILQREVFADPNKAPVWPGTKHQPKVLSPSIQLELLNQEMLVRREARLELLRQREGDAVRTLKPFIAPNPLSQEVRMNKANLDFIVANQLWYLQGQIAAFNAGRRLDFPLDAKEIKAHWKEISAADKPRYHWQTGANGKLYGLIALHVMTKDLPNWFWATWEHVDNRDRCKVGGCRDKFGVDDTGKVTQALIDMFTAAGMGAEWQNYRLTGSQTDFTDSTGRPLTLGNSEIEGPFMATSSCITCHAKATVNALGDRLDVFASNGQSDNGIPDPNWFYNTGAGPATLKFLQLDFEWSLQLAKPR